MSNNLCHECHCREIEFIIQWGDHGWKIFCCDRCANRIKNKYTLNGTPFKMINHDLREKTQKRKCDWVDSYKKKDDDYVERDWEDYPDHYWEEY